MLSFKPLKTFLIFASAVMVTACSATNPINEMNTPPHRKALAKLELLQPSLKIGEWLAFRYSVDQPGFINVYVINSSGKTTQLIQNKRVTKYVINRFPEKNDSFDIKVSGPIGTERFSLVFTKQPFDPLLASERKLGRAPTGLTLSSSQLIHRLDKSLNALDTRHWSRSDAILTVK